MKEIFSQQSLTKKSQFNFDLPPELIAQSPIEPRDASKLLVLDKTTGTLKHQHFKDIINFIIITKAASEVLKTPWVLFF